jgi:polysulfide reductase-like protein
VTEERQVPSAEFSSYYGRPILKVTRWREPHLPAYLFLGELSGAAAVLGAIATATGRPALARAGRLMSAGAAAAGAGFLTAELGRPERFLNMLRVAKPTSPMSMGSWTLAAHSALICAAAASSVAGRLPRLGAAAGAGAAFTGPVLATYPGALLANTAVPAWHGAYRELPLLFAGGAMTSAGAAGLLAAAWPGSAAEFEPARKLALFGAVAESIAGFGLENLLGDSGRPYREGESGRLLRGARSMTLGGGAVALFARRSRTAGLVSAALLTGGGIAAKIAVLRAGVESARDPSYVVGEQRARTASAARPASPAST